MQVVGEEALAEFRRQWTGRRMLQLLKECGGRILVRWAVGVGKSRNLDHVIEEAVRSRAHDLVVVLCPLTALIQERRWMRSAPGDVRVVHLRSRPAHDCGSLDAEWKNYERRGLFALGRRELCGACPLQTRCFWPRQYGERLRGVQVVFAAQQHLACNPEFLQAVQQWTGATRTLTILDEVDFLSGDFSRTIAHRTLKNFCEAYEPGGTRDLLQLLLHSQTSDLQCNDWQFALPSRGEEVALQRRGVEAFGDAFRDVHRDLAAFARSPLESRERLPGGGIRFGCVPSLPGNVIVYTGSGDAEFASYRLGTKFQSPFEGFEFRHPETQWINLASGMGSQSKFRANAPQIFDFFAQLVVQRVHAGKRPLLISKKRFLEFCRTEMERKLTEWGFPELRVIPAADCDDRTLADPLCIPLLHYGLIGVNRFEDFDAAYCLNSYYTNERIVRSVLQDLLTTDEHIELRINAAGRPSRHRIRAVDPDHRFTDVHQLAPLALRHQEMDVVLQAVGRVRLFTRPREIITFQQNDAPHGAYDQEFENLGQARRYFGCTTRRENELASRKNLIQACQRGGLTQLETAARLHLSRRTVQRSWTGPAAPKRRHEPFNIYIKGS